MFKGNSQNLSMTPLMGQNQLIHNLVMGQTVDGIVKLLILCCLLLSPAEFCHQHLVMASQFF